MTRIFIVLLGFFAVSGTVAKHSIAGDASQTQRVLVTPTTNLDVQKKWNVVVFKDFQDSSSNFIKRIGALPNEIVLVEEGKRCRTRRTVDTIKAQNAKIEVSPKLIRIDGGVVEITRSVEPTCQTEK